MSLSVDPIRMLEKFSDLIKEKRFKKGKIRVIVNRTRTVLERRETIIEGTWDTWVNNPPGLFLKNVETYDLVEQAEHRYAVQALTPEFSGKTERKNVKKKGTMFVSAHSILFIEFCE